MELNFLGYIFIFLLLYLFSKNKTGENIIYYSLLLILLFLLITNHEKIISVFTKGGTEE